MDRIVFQFVGHLHRIETKVDGSGRIHLDIDRDAFEVLQALQKHQIQKGTPIAIAAVPLYPGETFPEILVSEPEEFELLDLSSNVIENDSQKEFIPRDTGSDDQGYL